MYIFIYLKDITSLLLCGVFSSSTSHLFLIKKRKYDEFKDLNYEQLMKIMKLIEEQKYKPSEYQKEEISDLQDEVNELESQLEEAEYEYNKLQDENEELKEKIRILEKEK